MSILEKAQKMLESHPLCDNCLGRQFALLGYEMDNQKRGEAIKLLLTMTGHRLGSSEKKKGISLLKTLAVNGSFNMATKIVKKMGKRVKKKRVCLLCEGHFSSLLEIVDKAIKELKNYEYNTFLVGIELPTEVEEREDEFKAEFEVQHGENMRNEFSREIGKRIAEATNKKAEHKKPDITFLINPFTEKLTLQANPLYMAGRYSKLVRGIPQSRWFCRECRGKGCPKCNWTGKMYLESVEEIIAKLVLERTNGEEAILHAAGREDIDARMLGHGRPFVMEVKKPKKRFLDPQELTQAINKQAEGKVKVRNLHFSRKETIEKLKKAEAADKIYRATIQIDRNISDEEIEVLEKALTDAVINQQTPLRVLHRRSDRVREKHIYKTKIKRLAPNRVEMKVKCQGGLYIKELITGDEGRTQPSVANLIGAKAETLELDVLSVIMKRAHE